MTITIAYTERGIGRRAHYETELEARKLEATLRERGIEYEREEG